MDANSGDLRSFMGLGGNVIRKRLYNDAEYGMKSPTPSIARTSDAERGRKGMPIKPGIFQPRMDAKERESGGFLNGVSDPGFHRPPVAACSNRSDASKPSDSLGKVQERQVVAETCIPRPPQR